MSFLWSAVLKMFFKRLVIASCTYLKYCWQLLVSWRNSLSTPLYLRTSSKCLFVNWWFWRTIETFLAILFISIWNEWIFQESQWKAPQISTSKCWKSWLHDIGWISPNWGSFVNSCECIFEGFYQRCSSSNEWYVRSSCNYSLHL